jgi:hypothetical protein
MSKSSPSMSKGTSDASKYYESSTAKARTPSSKSRVPTQLSIDKGENEPVIEREPLVSRNKSDNDTTDKRNEPGCCFSCIPFRFCGSLCG